MRRAAIIRWVVCAVGLILPASGLAAGTYVVKPAKVGYRMDPLSKRVTVPASITTCSFKAIKL